MRRYPRINPERIGVYGPAALPLFCLAPHGVFRASRIAPRAVSSYLAFSPLPASEWEAISFPYISKNRPYVFCDTFRRHDLWIEAPACFTRHAAVWCSDFPLASRKRPPAIICHRLKLYHNPGSGKAVAVIQNGEGTAIRKTIIIM